MSLGLVVPVHSSRPLAGEGLGARIVDSTTDPLSYLAGREGTERLRAEKKANSVRRAIHPRPQGLGVFRATF